MIARKIRIFFTATCIAGTLIAGASTAQAAAPACGSTAAELAAASRAEGGLRLVAVPDTWANYEALRRDFSMRYGVPTTVLEPDASSARELDIFQEMNGKSGRPDVYDLGMAYLPTAVAQGVLARYTPRTWKSIPKQFRDPEHHWVGNYFGLIGFGTNVTVQPRVPTAWKDLLDPAYRGQVFLNGDPRQSSTALASVASASLANGGSLDDIGPGIDYFARMKAEGNLGGSPVTRDGVVAGRIPVGVNWNFTWPLLRPEASGNGFDVRAGLPADGLLAGFYGQGVSSDAEHPCAARLWLTWLSSNAGQRLLLASGAVPARYAALRVEAPGRALLPSRAVLARAVTPNSAQLASMLTTLRRDWGPKVAGS